MMNDYKITVTVTMPFRKDGKEALEDFFKTIGELNYDEIRCEKVISERR